MAGWTGKRIKALREAFGESQKVFAERFGVDQSTISLWEQDETSPRGPALMILQQVAATRPERAA